MRQYTTSEQTAKLIELGFEKPNIALVKAESLCQSGTDLVWRTTNYEQNYSIGELIEMLPMGINNDGRFEDLLIHPNYYRWVVKYSGFFREPTYQSCMKELIDALYDMVVQLKNEGVI